MLFHSYLHYSINEGMKRNRNIDIYLNLITYPKLAFFHRRAFFSKGISKNLNHQNYFCLRKLFDRVNAYKLFYESV